MQKNEKKEIVDFISKQYVVQRSHFVCIMCAEKCLRMHVSLFLLGTYTSITETYAHITATYVHIYHSNLRTHLSFYRTYTSITLTYLHIYNSTVRAHGRS